MLTLRSIGIAVAITCSLLFGMVNSSDAAEITSMSLYASDYGYTTVLLTADEDIDFVEWSINRDPHDPDSEYEKLFTSSHSDRSIEVYLGFFPGHIKGKKYRIKAVAWFRNEDNTFTTNTDTVPNTVYQPITTSGILKTEEDGGKDGKFRVTGAYGYAAIYRQYFDGLVFGMSGSAYASNGTQHTLSAVAWFRHREYTGEDGAVLDEKLDNKSSKEIKPGQSYNVLSNPMILEYWHGRPMRRNEERFFNAHTHLQVSSTRGARIVDDWEADTQQQTGTAAVKFTHEDNPE